MKVLVDSGLAQVAAVLDVNPEVVHEVLEQHSEAVECKVNEDLLNSDLDAVVVATPSALHPQQVIAALNHGLAVVCQKPLARTEAEYARCLVTVRSLSIVRASIGTILHLPGDDNWPRRCPCEDAMKFRSHRKFSTRSTE